MGCQVRQGWEGVGVGVGCWDVGCSLVMGCLSSDEDDWSLVSDEDDSCRLEPLDRAFLTNLPSCAYTGARFRTGPSRMEEASAGL